MIWVKHPNYNIEVSNTGRVRGTRSERIARLDRYGYLRINISTPGKTVTRTIHRLVADCFDLPGTGETIDHIDGDKTNNHVSNLQRMSAGANCSKSFKQGLRENTCVVTKINNQTFYSKREASRQTGISRHNL
jgi:hypothetical protein